MTISLVTHTFDECRQTAIRVDLLKHGIALTLFSTNAFRFHKHYVPLLHSFQGNCLSLISLPSPLGEGYGGEAFFSPLGEGYGGEAVIQKYSCFLCHSFGLCYLCTNDSERNEETDQNIDWHGDDGMDAVASVDPRCQQRQ